MFSLKIKMKLEVRMDKLLLADLLTRCKHLVRMLELTMLLVNVSLKF